MNGDDPYADQDPESFNQWFPLEHEGLAGLPFKLYFAKVKSNSPEAIELFMDPINALRGNSESLLAALPGVDAETRVTTTIIGHERTLRLRAILLMATYDEQDNSVSLTSHKQRPTD
jgi:hypothetical protein